MLKINFINITLWRESYYVPTWKILRYHVEVTTLPRDNITFPRGIYYVPTWN